MESVNPPHESYRFVRSTFNGSAPYHLTAHLGPGPKLVLCDEVRVGDKNGRYAELSWSAPTWRVCARCLEIAGAVAEVHDA